MKTLCSFCIAQHAQVNHALQLQRKAQKPQWEFPEGVR